MVGSERKALEMACPTVVMDFAKPSAERFVFSDIEPEIEPDTDYFSTNSVSAQSYEDRETFTQNIELLAGEKTLSINFPNEYYKSSDDDTDLLLTNIEVNDPNGNLILELDFSSQEHRSEDRFGLADTVDCGNWGGPNGKSFRLWNGRCSLELPLSASLAGAYEVAVSAWGKRAQTSEELPKIMVSIKSDAVSGQSNGAKQIKSKIVELYGRFHGVDLDVDHPDVTSTYDLMRESWEERKTFGTDNTQGWPVENCSWDNWRYRTEEANADKDGSGMKYAWMTTLIMLMTDFNYLHE